jgi:hypothetical protein
MPQFSSASPLPSSSESEHTPIRRSVCCRCVDAMHDSVMPDCITLHDASNFGDSLGESIPSRAPSRAPTYEECSRRLQSRTANRERPLLFRYSIGMGHNLVNVSSYLDTYRWLVSQVNRLQRHVIDANGGAVYRC